MYQERTIFVYVSLEEQQVKHSKPTVTAMSSGIPPWVGLDTALLSSLPEAGGGSRWGAIGERRCRDRAS